MGNNNTSLGMIDNIEHEISRAAGLIELIRYGFICSDDSSHLISADAVNRSLQYVEESLSEIREQCHEIFDLNKLIHDLEPHELTRLKSLARKNGETVLEFVGKINNG